MTWTGVEDMDSYREYNDIGPNEKGPREPQGKPVWTTDDFSVWMFESETASELPDTYVVARDPEPLDFRMWIFAARGDVVEFVLRASHKYSPEEQMETGYQDCCEVLMEGRSLTAIHCPDAVADLVAELTETDVVLPDARLPGDSDGPISY